MQVIVGKGGGAGNRVFGHVGPLPGRPDPLLPPFGIAEQVKHVLNQWIGAVGEIGDHDGRPACVDMHLGRAGLQGGGGRIVGRRRRSEDGNGLPVQSIEVDQVRGVRPQPIRESP